jgi:uncharacterized protein (DUF1800 family)
VPPVYRGPFRKEQAERLLWRAGYGPRPGEAERLARLGLHGAVHSLTRPGRDRLKGPRPHDDDGRRLAPLDRWGHDQLWWLDRMVRTTKPLHERMTLVWHDWFATSRDGVGPARLMLRQNQLFRRTGLGSFQELLLEVTKDPAMLLWLSGVDNEKDAPNENYARELMELFTLGSGYTERDVREAARALTGYTTKWNDRGLVAIKYDPAQHDPGVKRVLGRRGRLGVDDVLDLVCAHPRHAPFLVGKLWDFFVATPPSRTTVRALAATYTSSGGQIKPVVRAILEHPALYANLDAPDLVKCPVVYVVGAMRTSGTYVTHEYPTWLLGAMGQYPFAPPSVAGWDWGPAWMSSNSMRQRFAFANFLLAYGRPQVKKGSVKATLAPAKAFELAHAAVGSPPTSGAIQRVLTHLAAGWFNDIPKSWRDQADWRAESLQRTLRHLLIAGPESQLC